MILREAILHIPLSQYAFTNSETNITIRIRTKCDNLVKCNLWYGDRVQPSDPIIFTKVEMKKIASDEYFDYYDATFDTPYDRVCYYFELFDENESLLYFADIFSSELPLERSEFYQYPFMRREEIVSVPKWFENAVVYNIFPDSFASGRRKIVGKPAEFSWEDGKILKSRLGGTINGILENLDYIENMGFNCIYLNPIFTAAEYHKYDLLDYFHVAPTLGTDDDFRKLVNEVHRREMHIIIDGVFNHCSWYFKYFNDVVEKGEQSEYKDWSYYIDYPVKRPETETETPAYSCFAYERKMPKLNSSNPKVRDYFMDVSRFWIREFGVDGWRLDVANEVDKEFWRCFRDAAKSENPDSVMIAEIWESAETWLNGDMFDSTMNYDFRKNCRDFFGTHKISTSQFHNGAVRMLMRYRTGTLLGQLNLLDSHDVNRFFSYCGGNLKKLELAEVFLFTFPGVPCVFYGDELEMDGNTEFALRGPMPWNEHEQRHVNFFKELISIRKTHEALVYGEYKLLFLNDNGIYIYQRTYQSTVITICLNNSQETADICNYAKSGELLMGSSYEGEHIQPYGYAILLSEK